MRFLLILLALAALPAYAAPKAVATVLPLHSLLSAVMQDVGEAQLLIPANQSPHDIHLRPSQARQLNSADLVVWVGEGLETGLVKPIRVLGDSAKVLTLSHLSNLNLLPIREGGDWEAHAHGDASEHSEHHHSEHHHGEHHHSEHHHGADPHFWLSPVRAARAAQSMMEALVDLDPANADRYRSNTKSLLDRLAELDAKIADQLAPIADMPYLVFHDAYQYFESQYGLNAVGSVTLNPSTPPGARRLAQLRRKIADTGAVCVFSEPQFKSSTLRPLKEGLPIRLGELDPIGAAQTPGPEAYFALMHNLANGLTNCLGKPSI